MPDDVLRRRKRQRREVSGLQREVLILRIGCCQAELLDLPVYALAKVEEATHVRRIGKSGLESSYGFRLEVRHDRGRVQSWTQLFQRLEEKVVCRALLVGEQGVHGRQNLAEPRAVDRIYLRKEGRRRAESAIGKPVLRSFQVVRFGVGSGNVDATITLIGSGFPQTENFLAPRRASVRVSVG